MNIYTITYERNGKEITTTRRADTAQEAIEKLCDQYGWYDKLKQYDADTRGCEWAEVNAYEDSGYCCFITRIVATRKNDCKGPDSELAKAEI